MAHVVIEGRGDLDDLIVLHMQRERTAHTAVGQIVSVWLCSASCHCPKLEWAKSVTWKGLHPVVELSRQVDQKGVKLSGDGGALDSAGWSI
jgi:hypothetical protein